MIKIVVTTADYRAATGAVDVPDDWYSVDSSLRYALLLKRRELIKAYSDATGMSEMEIVDGYEGGIDSWIGFGSVTCFEIGCNTYVGFKSHDIVVIIE